MLRHKYTKKKLRSKYNRKKRTRKHGGTKNPKKRISEAKRKEAERLSLRTSLPEQKMSPKDERDAQAKMAELLDQKCEAAKHVNNDGSIDCPNKRSKAIRKISKFHNDKSQNEGCKDYANNMMAKYNQTCYGDDTNPDRKWDKNNTNYRNEQAAQAGFYPGEASAAAVSSEEKQIPSTCKKPASKVTCRYCEAKGVTDPKCKCCVGSDMAKEAIKKEQLMLQDGSVGPSPRDLVTPQKVSELPIVSVKEEEPIQPAVITQPESTFSESDKKVCADKVKRPHRGKPGLIKNKNRKDQTNCMVRNRRDPVICKVARTDKSNVKKCVPKKFNPHVKRQSGPQEIKVTETRKTDPTPAPVNVIEQKIIQSPEPQPVLVDQNTCYEPVQDPNSGQTYYVEKKSDGSYTETTQWEKPADNQMCAASVEPSKSDTCFEAVADPSSGQTYYVEKKSDGSYTETTQWEKPADNQMCAAAAVVADEQRKEQEKAWDASQTKGSCRELIIAKGTKYWINPENNSISFEPIDGVDAITAEEKIDYYYNNSGKATFDPNDGTCNELQADSKTTDTTGRKNFIEIFLSTHFSKMQELDSKLEETKKVIPWLAIQKF